MNRREFLALAAGAAGTAAAGRLVAGAGEGQASAAGAPASSPAGGAAAEAGRMKVGCQRWGSDPKRMPHLLRCGVRHICASPAKAGPDGVWTPESCRAVRQAVQEAGLSAEMMYLGVPTAVLHKELRDPAIEKVCRNIRAAGEGGIPGLQYNLHVLVWNPRTEPTLGRGGARYGSWDLSKAADRPRNMNLGPISAGEMWDRITYFLEKVVPVAAEAKVRLACHPPDPPVPAENRWKIAQVLDTVEGLQKFVSTCESPYHGLNFCQGCIWEMLPEDRKPEGLYEAIRWFGGRKKIFGVHFRNLRGGREKFAETFHDEGEIDMFRAARTYREVGYTGMLMPDHVPGHDEDPEGLQGFAFAYGYIIGLIQAAYATA